jgi:hypothetical protein
MGWSLFGEDELCVLCFWSDIGTALRLAITCKTLYNKITDDTFWYVGVRRWGSKFWQDAATRKRLSSCTTIKESLWRIERFQLSLIKIGRPPWKEHDFRVWWQAEEAYIKKMTEQKIRK